MQTGHKFLFEETKIVHCFQFYHEKKVRDTIEIIQQSNNINNRDNMYPLPSTWKTIVNPLTWSVTNDPSESSGYKYEMAIRENTVFSQSEMSPEVVIYNETRNVGIFALINTGSTLLLLHPSRLDVN